MNKKKIKLYNKHGLFIQVYSEYA